MNIIAHDKLLRLLSYDPLTGVFRWKVGRGGSKAGTIAGSLNRTIGYWRIRLDSEGYSAHRLAWYYAHGVWPDGKIDHRDLNPLNNAIGNLRLATNAQNIANTLVRKDSLSGIKGVKQVGQRWEAKIKISGITRYLGRFDTAMEASEAYKAASLSAFGEFARCG